MVTYICNECNKIFKQKGHYNDHLNNKNPCKKENTIEHLIDKKVEEILTQKLNIHKIENPLLHENSKAMSEIKTDTLHLVNWDATKFIKSLPAESIQCVICDPPFGLGEDTFDKHYARNTKTIIKGYETAPEGAKEYEGWAASWIHELPRVMKKDGTVYIVCAWNHVCDIELAIRSAPAPGLAVLNHIIWKYNFGVHTKNKFVSSHYHILRCGLAKKVPVFYTNAFFNETERTADGKHSAQYTDMEDVWIIPKEYQQGETKNVNKLPDALVRKMMGYSSKPGDVVADFFLGNFTTAYVARTDGRKFWGCELNENSYKAHAEKVQDVAFPDESTIQHVKPSTKPVNAGKRLTEIDKKKIVERYIELHKDKTKKDSMLILEKEFSRGHFSLVNILKAAGH